VPHKLSRTNALTNELFPQLAGQPTPYFVAQMKAFRDKSRSEENAKRFMWGISSRLSDMEIEQLASFYEKQTPVSLGKISDKVKYDIGKDIFTRLVRKAPSFRSKMDSTDAKGILCLKN